MSRPPSYDRGAQSIIILIMIKSILKVKGAKVLSKADQKQIAGGASGGCCNPELDCCFPAPGVWPPPYGGCPWVYSPYPDCI